MATRAFIKDIGKVGIEAIAMAGSPVPAYKYFSYIRTLWPNLGKVTTAGLPA